MSSLLGGAVAADLSLGSTPSTTYTSTEGASPQAETGSNWGTRTASTGDFSTTPDGKNDVWISTPKQDVTRGSTTYTDAGKVRLVSGASLAGGTPTIIRTIEPPEPQGKTGTTQAAFDSRGKFGFAISVLGDVTGDGQDDIAIGTDAQDTTSAGVSCLLGATGCLTNSGKAWVFNGATGAMLYTLSNPNPETGARFGSRIGRAGDIVTGTGAAGTDGKSEIIVGASNAGTTDQGKAYILNGADGTLVRTLDLPAADVVSGCSSCGNFGLTVQGPGDVDGDTVPDQLVAAPSLTVGGLAEQGRMYVFSGANGALIRKIDDPAPHTKEQGQTYFGFEDAAPLSPGDVNSDGHADIYGNGFYQDGPGANGTDHQGRAWVFSGAPPASGMNAPQLYEVVDPSPSLGGQFGWSLAKTDYDLDGKPDLYVGSSPHHLSGSDRRGGTYVFKGLDGSLLKQLDLGVPPLQSDGSNLGWSVAAPGNIDGDLNGNPDYVAGAPFHDGTNSDQGSVFTFKSGL